MSAIQNWVEYEHDLKECPVDMCMHVNIASMFDWVVVYQLYDIMTQ